VAQTNPSKKKNDIGAAQRFRDVRPTLFECVYSSFAVKDEGHATPQSYFTN